MDQELTGDEQNVLMFARDAGNLVRDFEEQRCSFEELFDQIEEVATELAEAVRNVKWKG